VTLSSIGLPILNGFVGEVLILLGSFAYNKAYGAVAALGMVLGAVYMLWMYQRVFLGKLNSPANDKLSDIGMRERLLMLPIIIMMFWIGVYSDPFLRRMDASVRLVRERIESVHNPGGSYRVEVLPVSGSREYERNDD
jgi:NADH-quinone oxidoreductase subunit M